MASEIDAEKLAAFEALLRKDLERRMIERGEAVHVPLYVVVGDPGEVAAEIESVKARKRAELRKAGETREIVFDEPMVIITGVPGGPDRDWGKSGLATSPSKPAEDRYEVFGGQKRVTRPVPGHSAPPAPSVPDEGPHRIIVQVRPPDPERGDHGEIAEAVYAIRRGVLHVDDGDRELGSQRLQPGDDPRVVARAILRTKKAATPFWNPIPYTTH
jgi:hypothetical protein